MSDVYHAVKIADRVHWVGAIDWTLRDFHGYETPRGTTYNAYLITGEKTILIDTVRARFRDEMMSRIASVIDPAKIDVIVSNHSEPDHSGALPRVIDEVQPEQVLASKKGVETLAMHYHGLADRLKAVSDGATMRFGDVELQFIETRMLHWPESMMTYMPADKLLFSQDGFGIHLAGNERFADELDTDVVRYEQAKYYANIIMPFGPRVTKALDAIDELDVEIIAPDHGPAYRRDLDTWKGLYRKWVAQEPTTKAVVVYATMWMSTERMARAICEGLHAGGAQPRLMSLKVTPRAEIVTEVLEAGALLVGSPTMNGQMFPPVADILTYLSGLNPKNKIGAAFGSYGWGSRAVGQINEYLDKMKVERIHDGIAVQYVPDDEALTRCRDLGLRVAERLVAAS